MRGRAPRPQPLGRRDRRRRGRRGRPRHRRQLVPGRPHGVLRLPRRRARPARATRDPGLRRRRRRHHPEGDRRAREDTAWRGSSPPTTARASASAGWRPRCAPSPRTTQRPPIERTDALLDGDRLALARAITSIEEATLADGVASAIREAGASRRVPVLGITGTGGSGKSSLTDELLRRFRLDLEDKLAIAVVAVDPTRRRGGGALLGDRIRMNAIDTRQIYFRSLGAGGAPGGIPRAPRRRRAGVRGVGRGPRRRRDPRHRAGRRGHRGARRRLALRDDARVRRADPAREDRDAGRRRRHRDQQVRAPWRRTTPCARSAARSPVSAARLARASRTSRSTGRSRRGSTTTASPRCTTSCAVRSPPTGSTRSTGVLADPGVRASTHADAIIAPGPRRLPRRDRPHGARLPPRYRAAGTGGRGRLGARRPPRRTSSAPGSGSRTCAPPPSPPRRRARPDAARAARGVARGRRALRVGRRDAPRPGGRAAPRRRCRARRSPASRSRRRPTPRASSATCARRTCRAGSRSRRVCSSSSATTRTRRGCSPARATRRGPTPVPPAGRGAALDEAVDRVRLGHPLRLRPRRAPGHLRQGRQRRGLRRDHRGHGGPVRRLRPLRAVDVGLDDDQRPRPVDPRHVPQRRGRPARRRCRGARRPGARGRRAGRGRAGGARRPSAARSRPTS